MHGQCSKLKMCQKQSSKVLEYSHKVFPLKDQYNHVDKYGLCDAGWDGLPRGTMKSSYGNEPRPMASRIVIY